MTGPATKAPWLLARLAQGATALAAVADVFRATALRAHRLHPTDASLSRSGLTSMVFLYLMTAATVLFLVWFSRCRRTAQVLSPGTAAGSGVWAVVAWFVPVVNLWAPRQLVLEVWHARSTGKTDGETAKRRNDALLNAWWAAWVGHALTTAGAQLGAGTSLPLLVVSEALELAAAVLAICVIQRITALQSAALHTPSSAGPLAQHA
ncbi:MULTISPECIES: DUF4328 domain-containing protein [Streptomyces]|uniref:DUF4328 domain-containing protein n=1 Tax=Streptomyces TaxID=1883 RepID=UPI00292E094D|nr:DUF4328 domain-containing protein [Streptomyces sp. NEAU-HV9]